MQPCATKALHVPRELQLVPPLVLKEFLRIYSHAFALELVPNASEDSIARAFQSAYAQLASLESPVEGEPRLHLGHECKHKGCNLEDCALCKNNPLKRCCHPHVLDSQYWVRDDGKGGQLIRAKCGASIYITATFPGNLPAFGPMYVLKLYIVDGSLSVADDGLQGLYLGDDGKPLFACQGLSPKADGGLLLTPTTDPGGPMRYELPDLQFLNKNSRFKAGGQTFRAFKMVARLFSVGPGTGRGEVVAAVETGTFKVTTKKGYDGCRKSEYLYCKEVVTDKTFANLGETTVNNLKNTFDQANTVEDLIVLVDRAKSDPAFEIQLRDTLNMSKDVERWRSFCKTLWEKVVYDDSVPRTWWTPDHSIGLVFKCDRGEVSFSPIVGLILNDPASGKLQSVSRECLDKLLLTCSSQLEKLRSWALRSWEEVRHTGWEVKLEELEDTDVDSHDLMRAYEQVALMSPPSFALGTRDSGPGAQSPAPTSERHSSSPPHSWSSLRPSPDSISMPLPRSQSTHTEGSLGQRNTISSSLQPRKAAAQQTPPPMGQAVFGCAVGSPPDGSAVPPPRAAVTTGWLQSCPASQDGGGFLSSDLLQGVVLTEAVLTDLLTRALTMGYSAQLLQQAVQILSDEQLYMLLTKAITQQPPQVELDQHVQRPPQVELDRHVQRRQQVVGHHPGSEPHHYVAPRPSHAYPASQQLLYALPQSTNLPPVPHGNSDISCAEACPIPASGQKQPTPPGEDRALVTESSLVSFFRDAWDGVPVLESPTCLPKDHIPVIQGAKVPEVIAATRSTPADTMTQAPVLGQPASSASKGLQEAPITSEALANMRAGSSGSQSLNTLDQWDEMIDEDFEAYLKNMRDTGSNEDLDNVLDYLRTTSNSFATERSLLDHTEWLSQVVVNDDEPEDRKRTLSVMAGPRPSITQLAAHDVDVSRGLDQLRSNSKGLYHIRSSGRHFPLARLTSVSEGVKQGQPVAAPAWWNVAGGSNRIDKCAQEHLPTAEEEDPTDQGLIYPSATDGPGASESGGIFTLGQYIQSRKAGQDAGPVAGSSLPPPSCPLATTLSSPPLAPGAWGFLDKMQEYWGAKTRDAGK